MNTETMPPAFRTWLYRALEWCESPIELKFGRALIEKLDDLYAPNEDKPDGFAAHIAGWFGGIAIQPDFGWCRPDFMLFAMPKWFAERGWYHVEEFGNVLIVEVDGHDFHERTKEQARRDRSRDRKMLANGWAVMRFTGQEVFCNATGCVDEVLEYWFDHQVNYLDEFNSPARVKARAEHAQRMGIAP